MDGNGRWAKQRGLPRSEGHKAGSDAAKAILDACHARGIRHLTLYTFSRENWSRPKDEVSFLFDLLQSFIKRELGTLASELFGDVGSAGGHAAMARAEVKLGDIPDEDPEQFTLSRLGLA